MNSAHCWEQTPWTSSFTERETSLLMTDLEVPRFLEGVNSVPLGCLFVCFTGEAGAQRWNTEILEIPNTEKRLVKTEQRPTRSSRDSRQQQKGCGGGGRGSRAAAQNETLHPSALSCLVSEGRDTETYSPSFSFVCSSRITESKGSKWIESRQVWGQWDCYGNDNLWKYKIISGAKSSPVQQLASQGCQGSHTPFQYSLDFLATPHFKK